MFPIRATKVACYWEASHICSTQTPRGCVFAEALFKNEQKHYCGVINIPCNSNGDIGSKDLPVKLIKVGTRLFNSSYSNISQQEKTPTTGFRRCLYLGSQSSEKRNRATLHWTMQHCSLSEIHSTSKQILHSLRDLITSAARKQHLHFLFRFYLKSNSNCQSYKKGDIWVISAMSQHSKNKISLLPADQLHTFLMKLLNTKMFLLGNSHNEDILYNIKQWQVYRCWYSWVYTCIHKKKKIRNAFLFLNRLFRHKNKTAFPVSDSIIKNIKNVSVCFSLISCEICEENGTETWIFSLTF